jgi:hypothetical protein
MCGFYAFYDGSQDYYGIGVGKGTVMGVVEGFGETLIGSRGFRVSKARVVALVVDDGLLYRIHMNRHAEYRHCEDIEHIKLAQQVIDKLLDNYPNVPRFNTFASMVAAYPEEDGGARAEYARKIEALTTARIEQRKAATLKPKAIAPPKHKKEV